MAAISALTIAGELFCNGVPLSNADDVSPSVLKRRRARKHHEGDPA